MTDAKDLPGSSSNTAGDAAARLRDLTSICVSATSGQAEVPSSSVLSSGLDGRTEALVRLAALMAMKSPALCYQSSVDAARSGGATDQEVIGTMIAVADTVGLSRVVAATTGLALALGYDIDAELEDAPSNLSRTLPPPAG